jgi:2-polyprenyl-6-hydroxyphenyl methylase/3-demethylubiquinone-9 3-methyltransferase
MTATLLAEPAPAATRAPAVPPLAPLFAPLAECKCCGAVALLDGYADFDRDCYNVNAQRGQVRGLPVPYYRCGQCDFAFTDAFDAWGPEDFATHIYNAEYELFDPNYASVRPQTTATLVQRLFPDTSIRILDYGSGNGLTATLLRQAGYASVTEYDPFHGNPVKPEFGGFDLVVCVEVAEHSTQPLQLFAELGCYAAEGGAVYVSTKDFADVKGRWVDDWYVAPRNGHVSFYTQRTLQLLAASLGRDYQKVDAFRHLLLPRRAPA